MIFRRLVESNARAAMVLAVEGYAVSVLAHALVIGSVVAVTSTGTTVKDNADSFTPVSYFIPKDKLAGSRPKQERITYMSMPADGGKGVEKFEARAKPVQKAEPEIGPGLEELASPPAPAAQLAQNEGDSVMTVLEVDSAAARYDDSAAPPYPQNLLDRRIEGTVAIQYIVDTTGFADTSSVVILAATHEDFAKSVRSTLPAMHFRPALMSHRKVRQLVQQLFSFKIDTAMIAQQTRKQAALGKKP